MLVLIFFCLTENFSEAVRFQWRWGCSVCRPTCRHGDVQAGELADPDEVTEDPTAASVFFIIIIIIFNIIIIFFIFIFIFNIIITIGTTTLWCLIVVFKK